MPLHSPHLVELLIRHQLDADVKFLLFPDPKWRAAGLDALLSLPTRKTIDEASAPFIQGTSLEQFVDAIARDNLKLAPEDYAILQELDPARCAMLSPGHHVETEFTIYP